MATTRNYLDFVCTQLEGIRGVDYKRMFGEYQIYVNDKPVLLVCDNTVFVKNHPALAQLLSAEGASISGREAAENSGRGKPCSDCAGHRNLGARHAHFQTPRTEDLRRALMEIHNLYTLDARVIAISSQMC